MNPESPRPSRRPRGRAIRLLALAAALAAPCAAHAAPFVPRGSVADAPFGFVDMCARTPQACGIADGAAAAGKREPAVSPACLPAAMPASFTRAGMDDWWADRSPVSFFSQDVPCRLAVPAPAVGDATARGATAALAVAGGQPTPPADRSSDAQRLRLVRAVNRRVNRNVRQRTDLAVFGVEEYWTPAGSGRGAQGDCEDIALEKRNELAAAGLSPDRLLLATAYVRGTGLHTVLIARLADGDYVLDSMGPSVARWDRVHYAWLRMQDPADPQVWRRMAAS